MIANKLPPIHPGEILLEEFLKPLGISQYRLGERRSACRRDESTRSCTASGPSAADTALRLARFFGTTERFWLNLQRQLRPRGREGQPGRGIAARRPGLRRNWLKRTGA